MAIDFNDRDDASVESYFFALNNLDDAVHSENLNKVQKLRELGRRPSLSTLVIVRSSARSHCALSDLAP